MLLLNEIELSCFNHRKYVRVLLILEVELYVKNNSHLFLRHLKALCRNRRTTAYEHI